MGNVCPLENPILTVNSNCCKNSNYTKCEHCSSIIKIPKKKKRNIENFSTSRNNARNSR